MADDGMDPTQFSERFEQQMNLGPQAQHEPTSELDTLDERQFGSDAAELPGWRTGAYTVRPEQEEGGDDDDVEGELGHFYSDDVFGDWDVASDIDDQPEQDLDDGAMSDDDDEEEIEPTSAEEEMQFAIERAQEEEIDIDAPMSTSDAEEEEEEEDDETYETPAPRGGRGGRGGMITPATRGGRAGRGGRGGGSAGRGGSIRPRPTLITPEPGPAPNNPCHLGNACYCPFHPRTQRRSPMNQDQKMDAIIKYMKKLNFGPIAWIQFYLGKGTARYRRRLPAMREAMKEHGMIDKKLLRRQCKVLVGKQLFDRYRPEDSMKPRDLKKMNGIIQKHAPDWWETMAYVLPNSRADQTEYKNTIKKGDGTRPDVRNIVRKRIATITSIVTHSIGVQRAGWMAKALGLFLVSAGAKRRVIEVLNNMGIVASYKTIQRLMESNAEAQKEAIKLMAKDPRVVGVFDNFCRQATYQEQITGETNKQMNMTTSYGFIPRGMPEGGLKIGMIHPEVKLNGMDIIRNIRNDGDMVKATTLFQIEQALRSVFDQEVANVWKKKGKGKGKAIAGASGEAGDFKSFEWPEMTPTHETPEQLFSHPISMHDETTVEGTLQVQDDILLEYWGLVREGYYQKPDPPATGTTEQAEENAGATAGDAGDAGTGATGGDEDPGTWIPSDFGEVLRIFIGDDLTIQRMLTIMGLRAESKSAYDRRDGILPIPAFFHVLMNLCYTIVRTHWFKDDNEKRLDHNIWEDANWWRIKGVSKDKPKFYIFQQVISRGFNARVLGIFMQLMVDDGLLDFEGASAKQTKRETVSQAIQKLSKAQLHSLIMRVYNMAFSAAAWRGTTGTPATDEAEATGPDNSFTTLCRYLQECAMFMTVRRAIRSGDIGHIRRLIDHLIPMFLGAGQWNYGFDMIYWRALLTNGIADPEVQQAVLATATVCPSGKKNKAVATDELLELHNSDYSMDIKAKGGSGHDFNKTAEQVSLNREAIKVHRKMFEDGIGVKGTNSHTYKSASLDIFNRAEQLQQEGHFVWKTKTDIKDETALSKDIHQLGANLILAKVKDFNDANARRARGALFAPVGITAESDDPDGLNNADARQRTGEVETGPLEMSVVTEDDEEFAVAQRDAEMDLGLHDAD